MKLFVLPGIMGVVVLSLLLAPASGCSEFMLNTSGDDHGVSGRTIDFLYSTLMDTSFSVQIRGENQTSFSSINPNAPGLSWNNRYGFVGVTSMVETMKKYNQGHLYYLDVLNEEGLSASYLWLNEAKYPRNISDSKKALMYLDVPAWIAGNFRTVDEVKEGLEHVEIWTPKELDGTYPLHLCVHDADKKTMIVEWVKNEENATVMNIYDGEEVDANHGVMTNSPQYPSHLADLKKFESSNPQSHFSGLPGGVSATDRFIRLSRLNQFSQPITYESGDITQAFHLLNSVDVAIGDEPSFFEIAGGKIIPGEDYTFLTLVRDHSSPAYYFRSWRNQSIRKIDLTSIDFTSGSYDVIAVDPDPSSGEYPLYTDVTSKLLA